MSNPMSRIKKTDEKTPWARVSMARDESIKRMVRNIFLIYCEGESTEPEYFKSFPVNTETIVRAVGLGMNRSSLIKEIIKKVSDLEMLRGQSDFDEDRQIWCVFDRDTRGEAGEDEDFNEAVRLADQHDLLVAFSNDAFELWFCLHDGYIDSRLHRQQYYEKLSKRLGFNYEKDGKGKAFAQSLYSIFLSQQGKAIQNAQRLHEQYKGEAKPSSFNPCTTVYQLVIALNACLKK
jgi:hypothetical protein